MKIKPTLVILNWLLSFLFLSFNGNSLILTFLIVAYFGFACFWLNRNKESVFALINEIDKKVFKSIAD